MVNDTYGHDAGDAILQKLSKTMQESITNNEFIIRFGGEEFLIIMRNPTEESAKELANKINEEFGKIVFNFNNESFSKTVSIGYAFYPTDTDQFWKCIKYADLCLYEAKETGRNKVIRFRKDILKMGRNLTTNMCLIISLIFLALAYTFFESANMPGFLISFLISIFFIILLIRNIIKPKKSVKRNNIYFTFLPLYNEALNLLKLLQNHLHL